MPKKKKPQTRRKRAAPQGAESHQRKQERLEERRRAKEAALIAQRRKERRDKAIRRAAFLVFLVAIAYLLFLRETAPSEIAGNPILSFSTSNEGQDTHTPPYNYTEETTGLNPPVSGRHDPNPWPCGTNGVNIPDENLVHSLEHGAVAVLYNPKELELSEIRDLEGIVSDYDDDVLVGPYPSATDPVVVASWSRKMPLDEVDLDAITEYIDQFRDTEPAPEANQQDCPLDEDDQYEPPEPAPSPSASIRDEGEGGEGQGEGDENVDDDGPGKDGGNDNGGNGDNDKGDNDDKGSGNN